MDYYEEYGEEEREEYGEEEYGDREAEEEEHAYEEQPELVPERNAFERAGLSRVFSSYQVVLKSGKNVDKKLETMYDRIMRFSMSPTERFIVMVVTSWKNLRDTDLYLDESALETLIDFVEKINDIGQKNALAYVLGFYVIESKKISKKRLNEVIKYLEKSKVETVRSPDVLRYARLWEQLLKKRD